MLEHLHNFSCGPACKRLHMTNSWERIIYLPSTRNSVESGNLPISLEILVVGARKQNVFILNQYFPLNSEYENGIFQESLCLFIYGILSFKNCFRKRMMQSLFKSTDICGRWRQMFMESSHIC